MFTGIITGLGQIVDSQPLGPDASHGRRLTVEAPAGDRPQEPTAG